jgi:hypothetical protein
MTFAEQSMTFRQSQQILGTSPGSKSGGLSRLEIGVISKRNIRVDREPFTTQQMSVVDDLTEAVQSRDQEIAKIAQSLKSGFYFQKNLPSW